MKPIVVAAMLMLLFIDVCAAQCMSYQRTPPPPGSKVPSEDRCNLPDLELEPGKTYTNMTTCMQCHCAGDLTAYCCSLLLTYAVPEDCVVVTKDCVQKVVYKSDGSPCQPISAISKK
ncbi:uncharacterized protein LOC125661107 [Ostrea edulis]|uniref:uncharacterized protein LOC125661107 n=1 Tax=Ostrea edulis TaxID=37623 RepID=UPI0024AFE0E2|nr:uncharacterized protein LOC125661107 [Ostrea edulis]